MANHLLGNEQPSIFKAAGRIADPGGEHEKCPMAPKANAYVDVGRGTQPGSGLIAGYQSCICSGCSMWNSCAMAKERKDANKGEMLLEKRGGVGEFDFNQECGLIGPSIFESPDQTREPPKFLDGGLFIILLSHPNQGSQEVPDAQPHPLEERSWALPAPALPDIEARVMWPWWSTPFWDPILVGG